MRPIKETNPQPSQCLQSFQVPKKGDLATRLRITDGITLSPLASKIYNSMLPKQNRPLILMWILRREPKLSVLRKGRSTLPHDSCHQKNHRRAAESPSEIASIVSVDFSKAFDRVNRKIMLHILLNYGVPDEIVKAIAIMYDNPSSFVHKHGRPN